MLNPYEEHEREKMKKLMLLTFGAAISLSGMNNPKTGPVKVISEQCIQDVLTKLSKFNVVPPRLYQQLSPQSDYLANLLSSSPDGKRLNNIAHLLLFCPGKVSQGDCDKLLIALVKQAEPQGSPKLANFRKRYTKRTQLTNDQQLEKLNFMIESASSKENVPPKKNQDNKPSKFPGFFGSCVIDSDSDSENDD